MTFLYIEVYKKNNNLNRKNIEKKLTGKHSLTKNSEHLIPIKNSILYRFYKSVHNSFIKPVQKPSYISSIKPVLVVIRKCPVYNSYE